jgi:hypothetical protein
MAQYLLPRLKDGKVLIQKLCNRSRDYTALFTISASEPTTKKPVCKDCPCGTEHVLDTEDCEAMRLHALNSRD